MSIASQIGRIQNAKTALKLKMEKYIGVSIPSSDVLDNYPNYFPDIYSTPPASNGVYIRYTDGTYSDYNYLVSGKTPVGVALRTDNGAWTMHPSIFSGQYATANDWSWGSSYGMNGRPSESNLHYNGQSSSTTARNHSCHGSIFDIVYTTVFADGSTGGWLASSGEWYMFIVNLTAVNVALSLIGGDLITQTSYVITGYYFDRNYTGYCITWVGESNSWGGGNTGSWYNFRILTNFS